MLDKLAFSIAALAVGCVATGRHGSHSSSPPWDLANFKSLVAFGDSYTDDSRLSYFASHNGSAPPVGWVNPVSYTSSTGGRTWVQYVHQYTSANIYNYAVSGAVCSNTITPRWYGTINAPFPSVAEYEIPAYLADSAYTLANGTPFLSDDTDTTVYAIWIGTNDLGNNALLTDSQVPGTNIVTYVDCVYEQLERLYAHGGRYFVLMNVVPLNLSPLYGVPEQGGVGANKYWPDKPENITEISYRMMEQVVGVNGIYEYRTPFEVEVAKRFPGARVAGFDVHSLFTDIHDNPSTYLNGTSPPDVDGFVYRCNLTGAECVADPSPDSFLWWDELHPSEQADRVLAREFVDVVRGTSRWASYWG